MAERSGFSPGSIGIGTHQQPRVDTNYRMVGCAQITAEQAPWLFDRVRERCEWVNREWKFDIHGLYEEIGIMKYDCAAPDSPAGHYHWHQDFGGGPYSRRKISIVSLLSNPADFRDGELRCFADQGEHRMSLNEQGDMVLFPSWLPHCVTPVNEGRRYSLVAWVSGPRFR
jgi:PKHD-type hydroxylase